MFNSRIAQRLNLRYPIIQAPCAPYSLEAVVAEVSNAGGLGSLSAALFSPAKIRDSIREIKRLTNNSFAVNLFAPPINPAVPNDFTNKKRYLSDKVLDTFRGELGIETPEQYTPRSYPFEDQLNVVLEEGCPVFSFTFGELPEGTIAKLKGVGTFVIGTATTVHEASVLVNRPNEQDAVDAIIAQGYEVGVPCYVNASSYARGKISCFVNRLAVIVVNSIVQK
jgi:nitronate monooxygenase